MVELSTTQHASGDSSFPDVPSRLTRLRFAQLIVCAWARGVKRKAITPPRHHAHNVQLQWGAVSVRTTFVVLKAPSKFDHLPHLIVVELEEPRQFTLLSEARLKVANRPFGAQTLPRLPMIDLKFACVAAVDPDSLAKVPEA
jgi:hypothetical protein